MLGNRQGEERRFENEERGSVADYSEEMKKGLKREYIVCGEAVINFCIEDRSSGGIVNRKYL